MSFESLIHTMTRKMIDKRQEAAKIERRYLETPMSDLKIEALALLSYADGIRDCIEELRKAQLDNPFDGGAA